MNKTATHTAAPSANATTKGAYMVYDHAEEETQTNTMETNITSAAIELFSMICLAGLMIAITLM